MPTFRITAPDGTKYRIDAPEGATEQDALAKVREQHAQKPAQSTPAPSEETGKAKMLQGAKDLAGGLVRGAGSIGSTLIEMTPIGAAQRMLNGKSFTDSRRERTEGIDAGLTDLIGSNPENTMYQAGKIGGEIAGTAGVGPAIAVPLKAAGVAPALTSAISSAGFRTGQAAAPTLAGQLVNAGARVVGGAVNGGASAALVNPEDAKSGALIGGALPVVGQTVGSTARAVSKAIKGGTIAPEVTALYDRAAQLGIQVPADRLANSKPLNAVAAGLNYVPFSGRAATEAKMQSQLNQALSRTFGQDSDNVTMALRKAQSDLGSKFDTTLKNNAVTFDQQLLQDVATAQQSASKELGADGLKAINGQIQELMDKGATGQIDGQAAYNIKRTLDRIGQRNTPEAFHARELKKALMGALDRSLGPQEAAAFAETRKQYGNMLALENLAKNGAEGDVSIARIANMKNINSKDLQELADISAQFLKPREGMHGAAQRAAAGLGVGSFAGAPALAGTVAAGRAGNVALNSNALKNALLGRQVLGNKGNALFNAIGQGTYRALPVAESQ